MTKTEQASNEADRDTLPMLQAESGEDPPARSIEHEVSGSDSMRGWAIIASRYLTANEMCQTNTYCENLLHRWMLACTYIVVVLGGSFLIWKLFQVHSEPHVFGWAVAGLSTAVAAPLSLHGIHMHVVHYFSPLQVSAFHFVFAKMSAFITGLGIPSLTCPFVQRYYIRILWMVPIYALVISKLVKTNSSTAERDAGRERTNSDRVLNQGQIIANGQKDGF